MGFSVRAYSHINFSSQSQVPDHLPSKRCTRPENNISKELPSRYLTCHPSFPSNFHLTSHNSTISAFIHPSPSLRVRDYIIASNNKNPPLSRNKLGYKTLLVHDFVWLLSLTEFILHFPLYFQFKIHFMKREQTKT